MTRVVATLILALLLPGQARAIDSVLTYQGSLENDGQAAEGPYDLQFTLQDAGGATVGPVLLRDDVPVSGGVFTVQLDFGPTAFSGAARFLQIGVRPGAATGAFTPLSPRTQVTPAPYAQTAAAAEFAAAVADSSIGSAQIVDGSIGSADINAAQVQRRVSGICAAGQSIRQVNVDGTVLCEVDDDTGVTSVSGGGGVTGSIAGRALTLGSDATVQRRTAANPLSCPEGQYLRAVAASGAATCAPDQGGGFSGWALGGNAGTNPATDYLGTSDNQPLVLRVRNAPVVRYEPSAILFNGAPITANAIAGSSANLVSPGVRGATIAGGGLPAGNSDPDFLIEAPNRVTDAFGSIGGGFGNQAGNADGTLFDGAGATVGGGIGNIAARFSSAVSGGYGNTAANGFSTVSGGRGNLALGLDSTIGGGRDNVSGGEKGSTVAGTLEIVGSTVGGGQENAATGSYAAVAGGQTNVASEAYAAVGGGTINSATSDGSVVVGGIAGTASGWASVVAGGFGNCAGGSYSLAAGSRARVRPGSDSGDPGQGCLGIPTTTTAGGDAGTFVWADSQLTDFVSTGSNQFLVRSVGGVGLGTNAPQAQLHVSGTGPGAGAVGVFENPAGSATVAIDSAPDGSAVLSFRAGGISRAAITRFESDTLALRSDAGIQLRTGGNTTRFQLSADGGLALRRGPNAPDADKAIQVGTNASTGNGAHLTNTGVWTSASSRSFKHAFATVDPQQVLATLVALPITRWRYRGEDGVEHLGPVAEDFRAAFGLGHDERYIGSVDADGVALAAIQGLNAKLDAENAALRAELAAIRALLLSLGQQAGR